MLLLRFVAHVALAVWVGGLVALGALAAPMLFTLLEAHDPAGGRELAGVVFGEIFGRFQYVAWACGLVVLVSLSLRAALGPRPRRLSVRMWVTIAMLVASVATVLVIAPRIGAIRDRVAGSVASLPDQDPRKIEFGRWHGLSGGLMLLTIAAGSGLMWAETRDPH